MNLELIFKTVISENLFNIHVGMRRNTFLYINNLNGYVLALPRMVDSTIACLWDYSAQHI